MPYSVKENCDAAPTRNLLVLLLFLYVVGRILQLYADRVPTLLIVALHVLPSATFALLHGSLLYRLRGVMVFTALCLGSGTFFESLSLRTGFPFGHYYFTGLMGPKIFQLPVLLALAYLGMGYLSWVLALAILGNKAEPPRGLRLILLPMIASCMMVAWDLSMDPIWANIDHAWVWKQGGTYFGVPISNFLGWSLTTYVFYQAFALYLRRRPPLPLPSPLWRLAILFYAASAIGNILLIAQPGTPAVIIDPSGRQWLTAEILRATVLVSLFAMGAFALTAWLRLGNPTKSSEIFDTNLPQTDLNSQ
ncbi:carotenoid biosynthesis protein [Tunturiibacter gelidoferens]|jgi:Carotenoid biosynthesis protein|uniref:Membrane protein n=1 Tax=Tunturiibacter gelidiferens TaxID=3069689 RepID=A0A9X0QB40_9BACT|nr:carotenoid biosynthesis protein [Edaphobacter lichenicola]MBB5327117.1 putative membrane protein [Edaphobacter lichenicola]